jgi:hypothetical protein
VYKESSSCCSYLLQVRGFAAVILYILARTMLETEWLAVSNSWLTFPNQHGKLSLDSQRKLDANHSNDGPTREPARSVARAKSGPG